MLVYADSASQLHETAQPWRADSQRIALVPTMGNLHSGHLDLCRAASRIAERVVATIFVNPTQFGENEDFDSYPRTPEEDIEALRQTGIVDAVFVPNVTEVYPHGTGESTRVVLPALSRDLCGINRPGHFDGVAGVVLRLVNLTTPDVLVLGEKDYQQLVLLRWLVRDLGLSVQVRGMPTARADDGLALSSRNRYLDASQRAAAPMLFNQLSDVAAAIRAGELSFRMLEERAAHTLTEHGFEVDYIQVRSTQDLQPPAASVEGNELIVLGAAWLGKARLIDNVRV